MELNVQVFGPWAKLVDLGHLERPTVVLEHFTVDLRLRLLYLDALLLHLFQQAHYRYGCSERIRQPRVLTFRRAEGDFRLNL